VRPVSGCACLVLRAYKYVVFLDHDQWLLNLNIKRIQDLIEAGNQNSCSRIPIIEYLLWVAVIVCMTKLRGDAGLCGSATTVNLEGLGGFCPITTAHECPVGESEF
jgi:hypothetical protein